MLSGKILYSSRYVSFNIDVTNPLPNPPPLFPFLLIPYPLLRRLLRRLCDFAKRCPLSFCLNTGIARVQASVAGKKPEGLLSC